jgi:hypothetical protein
MLKVEKPRDQQKEPIALEDLFNNDFLSDTIVVTPQSEYKAH